tara:strand:- start:1928 stop:2071 length:144 start_codon:yes stop_codon:yes gene_type:complete
LYVATVDIYLVIAYFGEKTVVRKTSGRNNKSEELTAAGLPVFSSAKK